MKGGYEIITIGSNEAIAFGSNIKLPDEEDKRIIEAINSGKPILVYPNFIAGGHRYTAPFFAVFSASTTPSRTWELKIAEGYIVRFETSGLCSYISSTTATTTDLDIDDPYAMPSMEV